MSVQDVDRSRAGGSIGFELPCFGVPALTALAEQHPGSYPVLMQLGEALEKAGEADRAMETYARVAALHRMGRNTPRRSRVTRSRNDA